MASLPFRAPGLTDRKEISDGGDAQECGYDETGVGQDGQTSLNDSHAPDRLAALQKREVGMHGFGRLITLEKIDSTRFVNHCVEFEQLALVVEFTQFGQWL